MSAEHLDLRAANETVRRDLAFLTQITEAFSTVFELDIPGQAERVAAQLEKVTDIYFHETVDSSEVLTSALDWTFSELEYETDQFTQRARRLADSVDELRQIHEEFVLSQALVMLVSSLEIYLESVFRTCLSLRLDLDRSAASQIMRLYNFQNWGDAVNAYRSFLDVELCPDTIGGGEIHAMLQRRHVLVHRMGLIDERAIRQLQLPESSLGTQLKVTSADVAQGVQLVRQIVEHVSQALNGDSEQDELALP